MSKQTPKKREPTLRELLERDAKFPLRTIGVTDEFDKTPVENAVSDLDFQKLGQAHEVLDRKNKLDFLEKRDYHKVPMPKTSVGEFIVDAFLGAKPAGERADTERAKIRELDQKRFNMRTNYGQNTPEEVFGMTALGNGPSYPRQSKMSKALGVTNKKAGI